MKCLRNPITDEVRRVSDPEARHLASFGWVYVPKSVYKRRQADKAVAGMKARNGQPPVKRRV